MKNISLVLLAVLIGLSIFSCSPETNTSDNIPALADEENCCGEDSPIPPPPPTDD